MSRGRWGGHVEEAIRHGDVPSLQRIEEMVGSSAARLGSEGLALEQQALLTSHLGLGPLATWVDAAGVTDVLVNGDGSVWVDRGAGIEKVDQLGAPGEVRALAVRLAGLAGRRLDDAAPSVDGLLPAGVRLHALLPPLVSQGAHISLRVPRVSPGGIADLVALHSLTADSAAIMGDLVAARASYIVCGGTGSGKTTLLGGLLAACPHQERIVLVEDVAELHPPHPHVVRLQARRANVEGIGEIGMTDLVRQALRMRPDRLAVGEVRGGEVRELLAALNTGHDGGAGTVHANGSAELAARFEALGWLAGMPPPALHAQLRSAVQVALVMERRGQVRALSEIAVAQWEEPAVRFIPAARFPVGGGLERELGWTSLATLLTGGVEHG